MGFEAFWNQNGPVDGFGRFQGKRTGFCQILAGEPSEAQIYHLEPQIDQLDSKMDHFEAKSDRAEAKMVIWTVLEVKFWRKIAVFSIPGREPFGSSNLPFGGPLRNISMVFPDHLQHFEAPRKQK